MSASTLRRHAAFWAGFMLGACAQKQPAPPAGPNDGTRPGASVASAASVPEVWERGVGQQGVGRTDAPKVFEALLERLRREGRVRMVLVGDTGYPGAYERSVTRAIRAERKDFVVALGDLIYPVAPQCFAGHFGGFAKLMMEERFHGVLSAYGAPVFLILGNHDVGHVPRDPAREACYFEFVKRFPHLYYLPSLSYSVDLGFAHLAFTNTNDLTAADGERFAREQARHPGWKLFFGHHVWRVYHDKRGEDRVRPWARKHGLKPDLWINGHAHLLQLVVDDGVWAVTSGTGALVRERPECPKSCGEGQVFGRSRPGYAVLEVDAQRLTLTFKDFEGRILYERARPRSRPTPP